MASISAEKEEEMEMDDFASVAASTQTPSGADSKMSENLRNEKIDIDMELMAPSCSNMQPHRGAESKLNETLRKRKIEIATGLFFPSHCNPQTHTEADSKMSGNSRKENFEIAMDLLASSISSAILKMDTKEEMVMASKETAQQESTNEKISSTDSDEEVFENSSDYSDLDEAENSFFQVFKEIVEIGIGGPMKSVYEDASDDSKLNKINNKTPITVDTYIRNLKKTDYRWELFRDHIRCLLKQRNIDNKMVWSENSLVEGEPPRKVYLYVEKTRQN